MQLVYISPKYNVTSTIRYKPMRCMY